MIATLSKLLRPKSSSRRSRLAVTVYTRAECCCCHKALDVLRSYEPTHGFSITEVDVDSDPALVGSHGLTVPVVAVDGKVRFKGQVNRVLFERLLLAESSHD